MSFEKTLRQICTYSSSEGTSGYLLSSEQLEAVIKAKNEAVVEALKELRAGEDLSASEVNRLFYWVSNVDQAIKSLEAQQQ